MFHVSLLQKPSRVQMKSSLTEINSNLAELVVNQRVSFQVIFYMNRNLGPANSLCVRWIKYSTLPLMNLGSKLILPLINQGPKLFVNSCDCIIILQRDQMCTVISKGCIWRYSKCLLTNMSRSSFQRLNLLYYLQGFITCPHN